MTELYHYTDLPTAMILGRSGVIQPGDGGLVWLTNFAIPQPVFLCMSPDNTFRYRVTDTRDVQHWMEIRNDLDQELVWRYELQPGAMPANWWVSVEPVPVEHAKVSGDPPLR